MRRLVLLILVAALGALPVSLTGGAAQAESLDVEAVIWQFGRDYPGAEANDLNLPIKTVYIKTHDGTDWMSTYDSHPKAVSGPDALRNLVRDYSYQGIGVVAWFVPYGTDIEGQLQRAREVIDAGVKGLVADVEPYSGFCAQNCAMLAEQFWKPLRSQRPNASLGVTYDPRSWWLGAAAIPAWLSVADMAAPECYWESFAGQGAWGDPGSCLLQAHADLVAMTPGRNVEFAPMLQGDSSASSMRMALDAAVALGAGRVSLWRRGVVPSEIWSEITAYAGEPNRPCWVTRSDNCLFRENNDPRVWLIEGGGRFHVPNMESLHALGYTWGNVYYVPDGFAQLVPLIPADGTLLKEQGLDPVYVVYGGARFWIPNMETFNSLGYNWGAVRFIPAGSIAQVSEKPVNYLFKEYNDPRLWLIQGGGRFQIPSEEALYAMGYNWGHVHGVPDGFAQLVPLVPRDGTLLREMEMNPVYVVYAGARFWIPNPDVFNSLGLDWGAIRVIPAGSISQVPEIPADYRRFAGLGGPERFTVVDGKKFQLDPVMLTMLQDAGVPEYTLWPGALDAFPSLTLRLGDVSCNEAVDAVDALDLMRGVAGLPNLGICGHLVGDTDCDGDRDTVDALKVLRWVAGLDVAAPAPEASPSPAPGGDAVSSQSASCAGIGAGMGVR